VRRRDANIGIKISGTVRDIAAQFMPGPVNKPINGSWLVCICENHRIIRSMTRTNFLIPPFTLRVSNRRLKAKARRKA